MTSIEWLIEQFDKYYATHHLSDEIEQAKEMERQQRMLDYTTGYNDGACNHVNDAEQYVDQTSRNK